MSAQKKLPVSKIKSNPHNPRVIKDEAFEKLVQSLKDFPEMSEVREVVVNKDLIILGGNMRFKAMKEAGWKEIPVTIVDWDEEKQRQFIIKDNVSGGEWDWELLAHEWNTEELVEWGMDDTVFKEMEKIGVINDSDEDSEWVGMPEFEPRDDVFKLVLQFETEAEMTDYVEKQAIQVQTKGQTTWSTWIPYKERSVLNDKIYSLEDEEDDTA